MLAERVSPPVNRTGFGTARYSRERIHKFSNSWPASTFSSSVDPLADRTTALSSPIRSGTKLISRSVPSFELIAFSNAERLLFQVPKTRLHDTMIFWKQIVRMQIHKRLNSKDLAPRARFELATLRLTAECSTVELPGNRATCSFSFYYKKQNPS